MEQETLQWHATCCRILSRFHWQLWKCYPKLLSKYICPCPCPCICTCMGLALYFQLRKSLFFFKCHSHLFLAIYSLSRWTSYHKISSNLAITRFGFRLFQSLTFHRQLCSSIAEMPVKFQSQYDHYIIQFHGFETSRRFGGKASYRLVNRGPEVLLHDKSSLSCGLA